MRKREECTIQSLSKYPCQWWHHNHASCTAELKADQPVLNECTHMHMHTHTHYRSEEAVTTVQLHAVGQSNLLGQDPVYIAAKLTGFSFWGSQNRRQAA